MIESAGEPDPTVAAELHAQAEEAKRDALLEARRRRQDFAYLATLALLVLRGDATMGAPKTVGESQGGSYITQRFLHGSFDLPATHKLILHTRIDVEYPTAEPRELAEALLVELTRDA